MAEISHEEERASVSLAAVFGMVVYLLILLVSALVALLPSLAQVFAISALLGSSTVTYSVAAPSLGRLQRLGKFSAIARRQILSGVISLIVGLAIFIVGAGVWALIVQSWLVVTMAGILIIIHPETRIRPSINFYEARQVRRRAALALSANVIGIVGRRADDVVLGVALGASALGQYSLGYRALTTLTEVLLHPVERVSLSRVANAHAASRGEAVKIARRAERKLTLIAGPIFAIAGVVGMVLIPRILGEQWTLAGYCCLFLLAGGAVQSAYWLRYSMLFVLRGGRRALTFQSLNVSILLTSTLIMLPFGPVGCSIGYLIGCLVVLLLSRLFSINSNNAEFCNARADAGVRT